MIGDNKYITINTDASFCPNTNVGGYAFWIRFDEGKSCHSSPFVDLINDSSDAEAKCIANSLFRLTTLLSNNHKLFEVPYTLVLNTDSMTCISAIKNQNSKYVYQQIIQLIDQLKNDYNCIKVNLKHVKAHSGVNSPRKYINDWCDRNAKHHMRKMRKQLKQAV